MADNSTEAILAAIGELRADSTARFDKMDSRLDNMERTDTLIEGEVRLLGSRVGTLEARVARIDSDHQATKRGSIEGDEAQKAALVSAMDIYSKALAEHRAETTARLDTQDRILEALTHATQQQTEMLAKLLKLAEHPMIRRVAYVVGLIILAWAAKQGLIK